MDEENKVTPELDEEETMTPEEPSEDEALETTEDEAELA